MAAATGKRHWRKNLPGPAVTRLVVGREALFVGLGAPRAPPGARPARRPAALVRPSRRDSGRARRRGDRTSSSGPAAGELQAFAAHDGSAGWKRVLGGRSRDRSRGRWPDLRPGAKRLALVRRSDGRFDRVGDRTRGSTAAGPVVIDSIRALHRLRR